MLEQLGPIRLQAYNYCYDYALFLTSLRLLSYGTRVPQEQEAQV